MDSLGASMVRLRRMIVRRRAVVFEATPGFILSVEVTSNYSGSVWVEEVRYFRSVVDMWWRVKRENVERARIERDFDTRYIAGR